MTFITKKEIDLIIDSLTPEQERERIEAHRAMQKDMRKIFGEDVDLRRNSDGGYIDENARLFSLGWIMRYHSKRVTR